ncbi:P-loop containing nucleoside triphosphate hydrolase protein [Microthyrium microscopicum]|uniref:Adenylate kinase isoenzyme 6 homolog n=1 Tax=Microthyrium microscopicum TaxID=703497 RepID=A0A6A6UAQ3_9PEZI|nr:P-loop containing nucleoside triphosphate hydrolase protein [Microthyrium microscopicum]
MQYIDKLVDEVRICEFGALTHAKAAVPEPEAETAVPNPPASIKSKHPPAEDDAEGENDEETSESFKSTKAKRSTPQVTNQPVSQKDDEDENDGKTSKVFKSKRAKPGPKGQPKADKCAHCLNQEYFCDRNLSSNDSNVPCSKCRRWNKNVDKVWGKRDSHPIFRPCLSLPTTNLKEELLLTPRNHAVAQSEHQNQYKLNHNSPRARKTMRQQPNIVITGTPGVGKSTHAEAVAARTNLTHLTINDFARERGCLDGHDNRLNSAIVDDDRLLDALTAEGVKEKGGYIIDWHACDLYPESWIDLVVVVRADVEVLQKRLVGRGYEGEKLQENIDSEFFQVLLEEARESYEEEIVVELKSDETGDLDANVERIVSWVETWRTNRASENEDDDIETGAT